MSHKKSLKVKFLAYVGGIVIAAFALTTIVIAVQANRTAYSLSQKTVIEAGHRYSNYVKNIMDRPNDVARAVASMFMGLKSEGDEITREIAIKMLKRTLEEHSEILGLWTVWEPGAFDGKDSLYVNRPGHDKTGRFVPYWNRVGGIHLQACKGYDRDDGYYKRPLKTGRELFMDPVVYEINGKRIMMVSICVPIKIKGKNLAVLGIDYAMDTFTKLANEVKPLDDGYIWVISNNGTIVAHPRKSAVGENVLKYFSKDTFDKIASGEFFTLEKNSRRTGLDSLYEFVPVKFENGILPWSIAVVVSKDTIFKDAVKIRNTAFFIGFLSIITVCVILYWIGHKIVSEPIKEVMNGIKDIAQGEGDLTKRLDIRSDDEIGELARWFNKFIDNLQVIISTISKNVSGIDGTSRDLLDVAVSVKNETENTVTRTELVAAAAEELSSNMNSVAGAAEQTSANINGVASAMEEMTVTISEISSNAEKTRRITEKAVVKSEDTTKRMDELGDAAGEIGNVVETITDISDQTNLLALNATIEAARAGEAGKGFAVVANEIKELANQTAAATNEIKGKIEWMQAATGHSVSDMGEIRSVILEISDFITTIATAVNEQSASSDEISNNVMQAAQGVQEVNENVSQSFHVSEEIAKDILEVNSAVGKVDESGETVQSRAEEMSFSSEELRKLVKGFKI